MRSILLSAAACVLIAGPALAQTTAPKPPAAPPAPAAAPAAEESTAPRIRGTTNGGPVTGLVYSVACPKVDLKVYEDAADTLFATEGRAGIPRAQSVFNSGQERFGAYVDCVQSNYNDDREALIETISNTNGDAVKNALAKVQTDMATVRAAFDARSSKGFKPPPRQRGARNQPPAAPAAPPPPVEEPKADVSRFEGRFVGTISAGELASATYTAACPGIEMPLTIAQIEATATPDEFNGLIGKLNTINDQFTAFQECLNRNANEDLKVADAAMLKGINDGVRVDQQALNTALGTLQRVISAKQGEGAPAARPAARPAPRRR
jgi:hypothetical protein